MKPMRLCRAPIALVPKYMTRSCSGMPDLACAEDGQRPVFPGAVGYSEGLGAGAAELAAGASIPLMNF